MEALAPLLAGREHPREVHEFDPWCRGEHVFFVIPRVGHGDLRPYVAGFAQYPGDFYRVLSGVRRRLACVNRKSWSSRFTCKTALSKEPTSGLEPLTCSLRVSQ